MAPGRREVEARGGPARRWSHDGASVGEGGEGGERRREGGSTFRATAARAGDGADDVRRVEMRVCEGE